MWTRSKSSQDEVILSQLVELARGDLGLVNEAIRATRSDNEQINLSAVVEYISNRMDAVHRRVQQPA